MQSVPQIKVKTALGESEALVVVELGRGEQGEQGVPPRHSLARMMMPVPLGAAAIQAASAARSLVTLKKTVELSETAKRVSASSGFAAMTRLHVRLGIDAAVKGSASRKRALRVRATYSAP